MHEVIENCCSKSYLDMIAYAAKESSNWNLKGIIGRRDYTSSICMGQRRAMIPDICQFNIEPLETYVRESKEPLWISIITKILE